MAADINNLASAKVYIQLGAKVYQVLTKTVRFAKCTYTKMHYIYTLNICYVHICTRFKHIAILCQFL